MVGTAFAPQALSLALAFAALGPIPPPPPSPSDAGVPTAATTPAPVVVPPPPVALAPPGATSAPRSSSAPIEFAPVTRTLARVIACAPAGTVPERFDARVVESHCAQLGALEEKWRQAWLKQARPFLVDVVPADLPQTVVYPFGGGDLLTALVTFPNAMEITTLSLEPAGDPRAIDTLAPGDLEPMLAEVREKVNHLFHYGHSKTVDMGKMAKSKLPGDLTYSLVALEMNQFEAVSVRFFRLDALGVPQYLTEDDLLPDATGPKPPSVAKPPVVSNAPKAATVANVLGAPKAPAVSNTPGAVKPPVVANAPGAVKPPAVSNTPGAPRSPNAPAAPVPTTGRRGAFANLEIQFIPRGGGPRRTFRHIAANLDDKHLIADPSVIRHLEGKGPITAITKAASYLLWWKEFGQIRGYLLRNMVWMISDSTGIPPEDAIANGFEQIPYGQFDGPFLGGGIRPAEMFRKLWADKAQPLAFRFGYPDIGNHDHLLITRRIPK